MKQFFQEIDKKIYFISFAIVGVMIVSLIFIPNGVSALITTAYHFCINQCGWLYIVVNVFCFGLFLENTETLNLANPKINRVFQPLVGQR